MGLKSLEGHKQLNESSLNLTKTLMQFEIHVFLTEPLAIDHCRFLFDKEIQFDFGILYNTLIFIFKEFCVCIVYISYLNEMFFKENK